MKPIRFRFLALLAFLSTLLGFAKWAFCSGCGTYDLNRPKGAACGAVNVPSALKLDKILDTCMVALKRKLLPIMAFSHVFRDIPLQGTDAVQVPFVPLEQAASTDFDQDDGYVTGDGTLLTRPVTINKRKYQSLGLTSYQLARNSIIELQPILVKKAEKLAEDVVGDIFSKFVIGNPAATPPTGFTQLTPVLSSAFDSDSIIAIRQAAEGAMWPESGRSLIVNTVYDAALLSDSAIKAAYAFGGSEAIRQGKIPMILGFDYYAAPVFPNNGINLVGIAALENALLVGFAPIPPAPGTRKLMVDYRAVTDPETGLTMEYREWGNPQGDADSYTIEVNYGAAIGDYVQALLLTSA